uniref:Uncharacterized protein n=1 Tax=Meloidogyne enterolobii TaxID=390850 RepID=A0A6V7WVI1_MELEN|nr:unnamed protein product [Meloidogyne enterolobii]
MLLPVLMDSMMTVAPEKLGKDVYNEYVLPCIGCEEWCRDLYNYSCDYSCQTKKYPWFQDVHTGGSYDIRDYNFKTPYYPL